MSIFSNSTQFLINTNILLFQNQIFLNNVSFTKKILKTSQSTKTKKSRKNKTEIIPTQDRIKLLSENNLLSELKNSIDLFNYESGEVFTTKSFNKINSFNKSLLDNRFIGLILSKQFKDSLFITLTTKPLNNLDLEVQELETLWKKIKKLLKKNNVKYVKQFEFTKNIVPHIHILVENQKLLKEIQDIIKISKFRNQIDKIKNSENGKVSNYITKSVKYENKVLLYGFKDRLLNNKIKFFESSSTIFHKKQRSPLFNAFLLHSEYSELKSEYTSENFINFCFDNVKHPFKHHNNHLKNNNPHFIINDEKVFHSSNLRVFSKYTRFDKNEKRSINKTHEFIIQFSKMLLNKIIIKKIDYSRLNVIIYFYYIVFYWVNSRIIIIKPPP